jgi:hypothetical protein
MPDKLSNEILEENKLNWTCIHIVEQCVLGKISKTQAHKLLDRKQELLNEKHRKLINNANKG